MKISTRPRRGPASLAVLLGATLLLTACGGGDDSDGDASSASGAGEFSATVEGAHGEITLDEKPERIVVIGGDFVDLLSSIDQQPVAFSGYGDPDEETLLATFPWLEDLYTGEFDPTLVTAEYKADAEAIALHDPDLIVGTPYYIEEQQYEKLSTIAPTYVVPVEAGWEWTDTLTDLGTLTGESDAATQVVADVESAFAQARERLTGLQGKTLSMADDNEGTLRLMSSASWMADLGLTPAENQPAVGEGFVELSAENLDQLGGDLAFLVTYDDASRASLEADPRFAELPSVKNESVFFVDRPLVDAGLGAGPASLGWLLEELVPLLEGSPLNTGSE